MIAVIADDFTGAAEIGGIGLRRGLKVAIETEVENFEDIDLLIIATDTRAMEAGPAVLHIEKITQDLLQKINPDFIFKKIDSVLRGNIVEELSAQLRVCNKKRALIIAGNPHFKRVIREGIYYVDEVPLADTFFATDPQYPISSSNVKDILKNELEEIQLVSVGDQLPEKGLLFGNVIDNKEMEAWGELVDGETLLAGGAGFFDTLIKKYHPDIVKDAAYKYRMGEKTLFVFGSTFPKSEKLIDQLYELGMSIINMPEALYLNEDKEDAALNEWMLQVVEKLVQNQKVIVTINHEPSHETNQGVAVKEIVGELVKRVADRVAIDDLLIEGGDTASVILKHLGISRLYPFKELGHGVIQMKVDNFPEMCITTKPGSYFWPEEIILNGNKQYH